MKKQALALAIASALVSPSAFAATDTSGMQFTSASEGFYASLRVRYNSGGNQNVLNDDGTESEGTSRFENSTSRVGVRGSNDLGGGLEGFYQWEMEVPITNGDDGLNTRLGVVGLRGDFGQIRAGSFWTNDYNWTHGSTDVANVQSGFLNYSDERAARGARSLEYSTPDLNGFQGAFLVKMAGGTDGNDLDSWNLAAKYEVQGFTVAGSYNVVADGVTTSRTAGVAPQPASDNFAPASDNFVPASDNFAAHRCAVPDATDATLPTDTDATGWDPATDDEAACTALTDADGDGTADDTAVYVAQVGTAQVGTAQVGTAAVAGVAASETQDDLDSWTVRLGYAQDNWYVNGWYGEDGTSDGVNANGDAMEDVELFSIAGGVAVDKVNVYAVYEVADNAGGATGMENTYGTFGVQYNLGAQSRVWIEYASLDLDTAKHLDDYVTIGLQHSF